MSRLICVDAGHGGNDSGAVGNGVKEKDIVLKISKKVGELLEKQGFKVIYTRMSDKYVNLGERCRIANTNNADLFISIHINSAQSTQANGTETLCYSKSSFAEIIQKHLISKLKLKDRGVKERRDLFVLNGTRMPAVLIEFGFLSNKEEAEFIKTEDFFRLSAEAVVQGVCEHFGIKYKNMEGFEMKKTIDVTINGEKGYTSGYFADGKNLFTADFIRMLGFKVSYDPKTKVVSFEGKVCNDLAK